MSCLHPLHPWSAADSLGAPGTLYADRRREIRQINRLVEEVDAGVIKLLEISISVGGFRCQGKIGFLDTWCSKQGKDIQSTEDLEEVVLPITKWRRPWNYMTTTELSLHKPFSPI